jgi:hypothetical protein
MRPQTNSTAVNKELTNMQPVTAVKPTNKELIYTLAILGAIIVLSLVLNFAGLIHSF